MMTDAIDGIAREAIESSNLVSIGYAEDRQTLAVEFKSGLVIHYSSVNLALATDFYGATSRGSFYSKNIKGKYPSKVMTGPCHACGTWGVIGEDCADCRQGKHYQVERRPVPSDVDQVVR